MDVEAVDGRVLSHLGLKEGEWMSWDELCERVRRSVSTGDLSALCGDCRWHGLNFCAEGLALLAASSIGES